MLNPETSPTSLRRGLIVLVSLLSSRHPLTTEALRHLVHRGQLLPARLPVDGLLSNAIIVGTVSKSGGEQSVDLVSVYRAIGWLVDESRKAMPDLMGGGSEEQSSICLSFFCVYFQLRISPSTSNHVKFMWTHDYSSFVYHFFAIYLVRKHSTNELCEALRRHAFQKSPVSEVCPVPPSTFSVSLRVPPLRSVVSKPLSSPDVLTPPLVSVSPTTYLYTSPPPIPVLIALISPLSSVLNPFHLPTGKRKLWEFHH